MVDLLNYLIPPSFLNIHQRVSYSTPPQRQIHDHRLLRFNVIGIERRKAPRPQATGELRRYHRSGVLFAYSGFSGGLGGIPQVTVSATAGRAAVYAGSPAAVAEAVGLPWCGRRRYLNQVPRRRHQRKDRRQAPVDLLNAIQLPFDRQCSFNLHFL